MVLPSIVLPLLQSHRIIDHPCKTQLSRAPFSKETLTFRTVRRVLGNNCGTWRTCPLHSCRVRLVLCELFSWTFLNCRPEYLQQRDSFYSWKETAHLHRRPISSTSSCSHCFQLPCPMRRHLVGTRRVYWVKHCWISDFTAIRNRVLPCRNNCVLNKRNEQHLHPCLLLLSRH